MNRSEASLTAKPGANHFPFAQLTKPGFVGVPSARYKNYLWLFIGGSLANLSEINISNDGSG